MNLMYLLLIFVSTYSSAQISSGIYGEMKIAFDPGSKMITGYYENYTGVDEQTQNPKFSCIFYLSGKQSGNNFDITTFYPTGTDEKITGKIEIVSKEEFTIKLPKEHGGCWNVQHFADEPVNFQMDESRPWIQIRFANTEKAYFYSKQSILSKQNVYIVKGDVVYVEKIIDDWAYCSFEGKKKTSGWMRLKDLNEF